MGFNKKLKITNTEDYVKHLTIIEDIAYVKLIRHIIAQLKSEQKIGKGITVFGRLIYLTLPWDATIIGDIHGDLKSLVRILDGSLFFRSDNSYLIFLGDYGDRGLYSPEVIAVVLRLKEAFPDRVIMLRGNHEGPQDMIPFPYDLPMQFQQKYGLENGNKIVVELRKLFDYLYNIAIIKDKAVLIHGGFPSEANSIQDVAFAHKNFENTNMEEMLWSDPHDCVRLTKSSPCGSGKFFGKEITERFLKMLSVNVLIRGHEYCKEGFKINHDGKVLTLFSNIGSHYGSKQAAYLELKTTDKFENAFGLEKNIRILKDD